MAGAFCAGGAYCSLANRSLKYWCSSGGICSFTIAWSTEQLSLSIVFFIKRIVASEMPTALPSAKPSALPSLMPAS